MAAAAALRPATGEMLREKSHKEDVRMMNIEAAKAVADAIRTSLGPRGADKMVQQADGTVLITNDGATLLNKMHLDQPAAKMLVELARSQDAAAGDGTTTVTVLCGALLRAALTLLESGVHPTLVSDAFGRAAARGAEELARMATPVSRDDREALVRAASTSLSSKVVHAYSSLLSPMAVDAVLRVSDFDAPEAADLADVRVVSKLGGTLDDSTLVEGLVLDLPAAKGAGGPSRVEGARVALIQYQLSPPKSDMENNVVVGDYAAMDRILKEERAHILAAVKRVRAAGCNVLLVQKSILRDAVSDMALHYLAKAKIMVVRDVERDDVEFISKTLGLTPVAHPDALTPERLAHVGVVEEIEAGRSRVVQLTGIQARGRTATILLRASNSMVLEEAHRSLHDALCVVRCLVARPALLPGGGAPEVELALRLRAWARGLQGVDMVAVRAFADALEVVPFTLAENAGLEAIRVVAALRAAHARGEASSGIDVRKGGISDMNAESVVQPLRVTDSALALATECVRLILKIDDVVPVR